MFFILFSGSTPACHAQIPVLVEDFGKICVCFGLWINALMHFLSISPKYCRCPQAFGGWSTLPPTRGKLDIHNYINTNGIFWIHRLKPPFNLLSPLRISVPPKAVCRGGECVNKLLWKMQAPKQFTKCSGAGGCPEKTKDKNIFFLLIFGVHWHHKDTIVLPIK